MTKILNVAIVLVMIAVVVTFVVSAISLQNKTDKILSQYSVRREELAGRQQQIQNLIITLNATVQSESENQKILAEQLGIALKDINATLPNVTTVTNKTNTTINIVSTPTPVVPKPPRIVTRGS